MRLAKPIYFLIALLIGLLILVKSLDYFNPDFHSGFLIDKKEIFQFYRYFLYLHIIGAPIALFAGLFQFTFKKSKLHQKIGFVYFLVIVVTAAPGGFFMSFYALGGAASVINFLLLSSLWFFFTLKAFLEIRKGNYSAHVRFMTRSFILTNSAILIRILSYFNNQTQIIDPITGYILIGWLSWLPALVVFEIRNKPSAIKGTNLN